MEQNVVNIEFCTGTREKDVAKLHVALSVKEIQGFDGRVVAD
jgi:hypothetical protein